MMPWNEVEDKTLLQSHNTPNFGFLKKILLLQSQDKILQFLTTENIGIFLYNKYQRGKLVIKH